MNWQVQKLAFLLDCLCRKRVLACPSSRLFNFRLLLAPANCLTNQRFSGRLFKLFIVYIKKVYSVCLLLFLFRTKGKKGHLEDENDFRHCYGNFFESGILKVTWSQLGSKPPLTNYKAHWQQIPYSSIFYRHGSKCVLNLLLRLW